MRKLSCSRFILFACLLLVGFEQPAGAHEKDLRKRTDAAGLTEISVCARPSPNAFGFPGHAFIAFSYQAAGGSRSFRAIGHTVAPTTGLAAAVFTYFSGGSVAGQQEEERYTHLKQACLTLKVDREIYQRALDAARPTLSALGIPDAVAASVERYSLNGHDCMDFISNVAQPLKTAGLSTPERAATDTPIAYIRKLIDANP
ncbi:hypothetical protein [Bradyrhizobium sp.]|uniref:hypothetical protein n=1 Tax=Bradyrhizobium sp. TaxID=376 RepID=UPI0025C2243B|nr:hypothetical protein [Bradyrhizobium sp.]